ncbi:hypothetical protein NPIL_465781 [Nephila pilipes]|uniref:Uncharacterized protein n=1 Tax=Nephila pilipes TaxID=299642 RepID=A0A8X6PQR8_NEPPI|nr:hypothetical protein NPIL_465781 [Nephila pilipes]
MEPKNKEYRMELKHIIMNHFLQRKSVIDVSEIVQRSKTTIHYIIEKFIADGWVKSKPKSCRTQKLSEANERGIIRFVKKGPQVNTSELAKIAENCMNIRIAPETI